LGRREKTGVRGRSFRQEGRVWRYSSGNGQGFDDLNERQIGVPGVNEDQKNQKRIQGIKRNVKNQMKGWGNLWGGGEQVRGDSQLQ